MKFSWKSYNNLQFALSFCIGWFIVGHFWDTEINKAFQREESNEKSNSKHCSCDRLAQLCLPCQLPDPYLSNDRNHKIASSHYRTYPYKPLVHTEDLTHRWHLLTNKHHYELINQEPRVGLNGARRVEVGQVEQRAKQLVSDEKFEMKDILQRSDPFHGTTYVVHFETDKKQGVLQMRRPHVVGKPKLQSINHVNNQQIINIISPISKVTERFNLFLERYERNVLNNPSAGPVRIIFVIFREEDEKSGKDNSVSHVTSVLDKFRARNTRAMIEYIFTKGEFNRAVGLHAGVMQCKDDEIVLFLDVDLKIGPEFLGRVRRNTLQHKRVIFPIMFSQYDPDILDAAAAIDTSIYPDVEHKVDINKQTGFWIYYAFGVAAMYKSDYLKVGGFRLDIRGWGGEDVDLLKKMIAHPTLDVMSIVDYDLIHIYHKRGCDVTLAADQYAMCVGAWAETLGSQLEVGTLYLNSHNEL